MIKQEKFWTATCDDCKAMLETNESYYVSPTKTEMLETLNDYGWIVIGKKCYCEDCRPRHEKP